MAAPKGHPRYGPGRAKGVPNKVTGSLREAILHAFDTVGGEKYLVKVARENPQVFCMLLARILPLQVAADATVRIIFAGAIAELDEKV